MRENKLYEIKMNKQKIDFYNFWIGIIYLIASLIIYSRQGFLIALFLAFIAIVFIATAFFPNARISNYSNYSNKNSKLAKKLKQKQIEQGSKFILFCYAFVMLSFLFPIVTSIIKKDYLMTIFVFLMAIVFFILYLKEVKSIKKIKEKKWQ